MGSLIVGVSSLRCRELVSSLSLLIAKSTPQGSEFGAVLLILPGDDAPILMRELIYTGLTRARDHVEIWSSENVLRAALSKRASRTSGLRDALWNKPNYVQTMMPI
jgi:exodeoxyribonuclease V alpha subunit